MEAKFRPGKLQIALAFLSIYIIWGSTYLAIRFAIDTIPPLVMAGARFLLAGLPLYLVLRLMGTERPSLAEWRTSCVLGVLLLSVGTGGVVLSEKSVPSGLVSLLVAMVPVYVAILEWMVGGFKKVSYLSGLGLLVSTFGIFILVSPSLLGGVGKVDGMGILMVMFSSFSWAFGTVISRKLTMPRSAMLGTSMQMIAGGAFLLVAAFIFGEHRDFEPARISLASLAAFGYLTLFGSIAAFSAYTWLLKHLSPERVSTYAYVNPVVAVLLGWVILGEPVGPTTVVAAFTILSGVGILSLSAAPPIRPAYRRAIVKTGQFLKLR